MTASRAPALLTAPYLLLADWRTPISVVSEWATDITTTTGRIECRRGLIDRPYRKMEADFVGLEAGDARSLEALILAQATGQIQVPMWPDASRLKTPAVAGTPTLVCDTTNRRFFVGSPVIVAYKRTGHRTQWDFEVKTILSKTDASITLTTNLVNSWPIESRVYPALTCEIDPTQQIQMLTSDLGSAALAFQEKFSSTAQGRTSAPETTPSFCQSFGSYPIYPFFVNWKDVQAISDQNAATSVVGLAEMSELYGDPGMKFQVPFVGRNRLESYRGLQFFDSRCGRVFPFWMASPVKGATITSVSAGGFTFAGNGVDYAAWVGKHISFMLLDGTFACHRVLTAGAGVATVSPSIDTAVVSVATIKKFSRMWLCRFDSDSMREDWVTSERMNSIFKMKTLRTKLDAEDTGEIPYVPGSGKAGDPGQWEIDGFCRASAPIDPLPMFSADCGCRDSNRPMFRAADFTAPLAFLVECRSLRPLGALALSNLRNTLKRQIRVDYLSSSSGESRHWHHLRWDGGSWSLNSPVTVDRHIWEASETYIGDDGLTYTFILRVQGEVSTGSNGAHGVLWHIYVFTNEASTYIDGTSYDASGAWTTAVTFTLDDPAVWVAFDVAKRTHPALVLCAHSPTRMESCCGTTFLDSDPTLHLSEYCNQIDPGLPWAAGAGNPDQPDKNVVFGHGSGYEFATFTLGGGCPVSEFFDWVTIEPGLTALEGVSPGWDVDNSRLVYGAPCVLITPCTPEQTALACCTGHPDSANVGSIQCWSSEGIVGFRTECCFELGRPLRIRLIQKLQKASICKDSGGANASFSIECGELLVKTYEVPLYTVNFSDQSASTPEDQTLRKIVWKLWKDDPAYVKQNYYTQFSGINPPDTASFSSADASTWLATGTSGYVVHTSVGEGFYRLDSYSGYTNFRAAFKVLNPSGSFGLMMSSSTSYSPLDGLQVVVDTYAKTTTLYRWTSGSRTLLAQATYPGIGGSGYLGYTPYLVVQVIEDTLMVSMLDQYGVPLNDVYAHLTAKICQVAGASLALYSGEANQSFTQFSVVDLDSTRVTMTVSFDVDGWHIKFDKKFWPSYDLYPTGAYDTNSSCTTNCCHEIGEYLPNADVDFNMSGSLGAEWACGGSPNGSGLTSIGPCGGFPTLLLYPPYTQCVSSVASCCSSDPSGGSDSYGDSGSTYSTTFSVWQWAGSTTATKTT